MFPLSREIFRDKVYGGWLGRNAGGTLGASREGKKEILDLSFYRPVPGQPVANEDLDLQLVALHGLRQHGPGISSLEIAELWAKYVRYTFDEFGYATRNLRRGLRPPVSGWHDNWFRHGSGAMGRCQLWAMVAPAAPHVAAEYAYHDATLDHAEEGVWAAMFWAAIQSAAFASNDRRELIEVGLGMIPSASRVARAVQVACEAHQLGRTWVEARSRILTAVGAELYADAPQNTGFAMLGWLYGNGDFGSSLCHAANCGYDCDGTAGAVGATLGILLGRSGLPTEWMAPLGDAVVLGWGVVDLDVERTVAELTEHTIEAAEQVVAARCPEVQFVDALESAEMPLSLAADSPEREPGLSALPEGAQAAGAAPATAENVGEGLEQPASALPVTENPRSEMEGVHEAGTAQATEEGVGEGPDQTASTLPVTEEATPEREGVDSPAGSPEGAAHSDTSTEDVHTPPLAAPSDAPALRRFEHVRPLWTISPRTAVYRQGPYEVEVDYGENGPAIVPNAAASLMFTVRNLGEEDFVGNIRISTPAGWDVRVPGAQGQRQMLARGGMARYGFVIRCPETASLSAVNTVGLVLAPEHGSPTLLPVPLLGGHCWHYVGPLANSHMEGFERSFEPEEKPGLSERYLGRAGAMVSWQRIGFRETVMDVEPLFDRGPGVLYLRTALRMERPVDARIVVHCNDGVRAWLNGRLLLQRHSHEEFHPIMGSGNAMAETTLGQGANLLVLKVVRCKDPVRLAVIITDLNGRPIEDLGNTFWPSGS